MKTREIALDDQYKILISVKTFRKDPSRSEVYFYLPIDKEETYQHNIPELLKGTSYVFRTPNVTPTNFYVDTGAIHFVFNDNYMCKSVTCDTKDVEAVIEEIVNCYKHNIEHNKEMKNKEQEIWQTHVIRCGAKSLVVKTLIKYKFYPTVDDFNYLLHVFLPVDKSNTIGSNKPVEDKYLYRNSNLWYKLLYDKSIEEKGISKEYIGLPGYVEYIYGKIGNWHCSQSEMERIRADIIDLLQKIASYNSVMFELEHSKHYSLKINNINILAVEDFNYNPDGPFVKGTVTLYFPTNKDGKILPVITGDQGKLTVQDSYNGIDLQIVPESGEIINNKRKVVFHTFAEINNADKFDIEAGKSGFATAEKIADWAIQTIMDKIKENCRESEEER